MNIRRNIRVMVGSGVFLVPDDQKTTKVAQDYFCLQRIMQHWPGPIVNKKFSPARPPLTSDYFIIKDIKQLSHWKPKHITSHYRRAIQLGASTGTGGEIRDHMGGGKVHGPLLGCRYMMTIRALMRDGKIRYPSGPPIPPDSRQILIKASNGASISVTNSVNRWFIGSVLTFEHRRTVKVCIRQSYHNWPVAWVTVPATAWKVTRKRKQSCCYGWWQLSQSVWVAVQFPLLKQVDTHRESNSMLFNVPMQKCKTCL